MNKHKWIKFTEREADLFTAFCILSGYTKIFKKHIGVNFKNFLVVYKKGMVNSYRDDTEYEAILQRIKKNKGQFLEILNKLEKQNELLKEQQKLREENKKEKSLGDIFYQLNPWNGRGYV